VKELDRMTKAELIERIKTLSQEGEQSQANLERSTHRLAVLGRIGQTVVASLDLKEVLAKYIDAVMPLLEGAEGISILLVDGQEFVFAAVGGEAAKRLRGQRMPAHVGIAGQVLKTGQSAYVSGSGDDEIMYRDIEKITNWHIRSLLAVPLRIGDAIIGVMEAVHTQRGAFRASDLQLLESASGWAAIAIANARYHEETRRRLRESQTMAQISRALSQTLDLDHILQLIVQSTQQVIPQSETAIIHLLSKEDSLLHPVAVAGTVGKAHPGLGMHPGEGVAGRAISDGSVINVGNIQTDSRYLAFGEDIQLKSLLVAPIASGEERLGTISVQTAAANAFTADDERLLMNLGINAAIALENARLYTDLKLLLQEREQRQAQLIRVEKMAALGRLVASLAHEINNPLQALRSGFRLLLARQLSDEKRQQYLEIASNEIERLIVIVERVLEFYRPSRTRATEIKKMDLNALIDETLLLVSKQLEHAQITIHRQLADPLPSIEGVGNELKQVFLNLILNALQAMPEGGALTLSTGRCGENEICATVTDTGVGISDEDLPHIFEPFYTTRSDGTGLGLAITYSLVDRHNGRINVKSQINQGSSFAVILPIKGGPVRR
jgi:two-component system, NtrC family, sensor kinase